MRLRNLLHELVPPVLSLLLALILSAVLIAVLGQNPMPALQALLIAPFQSRAEFGEVLRTMVPLLLSGLAAVATFRAGIFNLGVEGQLYLGAFAAAWVGFTFHAPGILLMIGAMLFASLVGAAFAYIPGALRAYFNANEVVTTIMLNYVAIYLADYLVTGPFSEPNATNPQSAPIAASAHLPRFLSPSRAHIGVFIALALAVVVHLLLYRTTLGYELRMTGTNPKFAEYGGINVARTILLSMLISGLIAGLLGAIEILGIQYRFRSGFSPGYGFDGITVALLARVEPLAVPFAAFLFAVLREGANIMQINTNVGLEVVNVLQAIIILFVTAEGLWAFLRSRRAAIVAEKV